MDIDKALETATVEESLFVWMTIHGNLCLALRHPENDGPSRAYMEAFINKLSMMLVQRGMLTQQDIERAQRVEREFRPQQQQGGDSPVQSTGEDSHEQPYTSAEISG